MYRRLQAPLGAPGLGRKGHLSVEQGWLNVMDNIIVWKESRSQLLCPLRFLSRVPFVISGPPLPSLQLSGFTLALPTLVLPFLLPNHVLFPYKIYSSEPFFWSWEVISLLISQQANSCTGISGKKVLWYYGQCSVVSDINKTHSDNVLSHSVGSDVSLQSVFTGGLVETRGG